MDAKDEILGRLSTKIAGLLMGKGKATFSHHMDMGDYVVVINAEKIMVTGKKASQKVYITHSGYPGGFKSKKYSMIMERAPGANYRTCSSRNASGQSSEGSKNVKIKSSSGG